MSRRCYLLQAVFLCATMVIAGCGGTTTTSPAPSGATPAANSETNAPSDSAQPPATAAGLKDHFAKLQAAIRAEEHFKKVFEKKEAPETIREAKIKNADIISALIETGLASSRSEAKRLLKQGGIKVDNIVVGDENHIIKKSATIQKGKRHFVKVII